MEVWLVVLTHFDALSASAGMSGGADYHAS